MITELCSVKDELVTEVIRYREYLHRHPELSNMEFKTAAWIETLLNSFGCDVIRVGATGIVGTIRNGDGPVVAYRADMDGLPVKEKTGLPFASEETAELEGREVPVMHACGHDIHMAVALGIAKKLTEHRDGWCGTVLMIFQPAEENATGAKRMVADGLWELLPKPEIIFGAHVMPYAAGNIYLPIGTAMSMGDSWRVRIRGKGAHGSQPEQSIDPIVQGASTILRLQTIISREVGPKDTAVLTVGTFHGGIKENVISDEAEFSINVRTYDKVVRQRILESIRRMVLAEAHASGAPKPIIETISEFPECYNDPQETQQTIKSLQAVMGEERVKECEPHMASEDFGYLGQSVGVPSVYWFIGGSMQKNISDAAVVPVNHSPEFAPESEPTLEVGVSAGLAAILYRLHQSN